MGLGYLKEKCGISVYMFLLPFSDMLTTRTLIILYKTLQYCMMS